MQIDSKNQNLTGRETVLDVLKGISIIFVIIVHLGWDEKQRLYGLFPFTIDMAVPIFMIITGYVYSKSYIEKGTEKFIDAYDTATIVKRIIRYTIPFLSAYILEIALFYIGGYRFGITDVIKNFFLGGFGPGSYYYPIMMQIIFLLPLVLFSVRTHPRAGLLFWFCFNALYEFAVTFLGVDQSIYRISIFRYTFLLAFGCFIFLQINKRINMTYMILTFIAGLSYVIALRYLGYTPKIINYDWSGTSFLAGLYIAPVIMLIIYKFKSFSVKPLEMIGRASYNILLTQMVYYGIAYGTVSKYVNSICAGIVINLVVCVCGGMLFYFVEHKLTMKIIDGVVKYINSHKRGKAQDN